LKGAEQAEFERLIGKTGEVKQMVTSWKREGIKEGEEQEARRVALQQLAELLGELPAELSEQVQQLPIKRARKLTVALLKFKSVDDLLAWLNNN
jgi:hypothetical protein